MKDNPCLECEYRNMEGNSCALLCLRLAAYNSGKDWEDKPLPYVAKQKNKKVKIMEETETGDQKSEVGDPEDPEKTENICVICLNPDKPILNKRSQTCGSCYQAWNTGKIVHPTLGKFKPSLTKSKIKESPKLQPEVKAAQPKKPVSRSYPFPDLVTLDFSRYPEIKAIVFETAGKFLVPPEHIIISLIGEGIIARGKKED